MLLEIIHMYVYIYIKLPQTLQYVLPIQMPLYSK